MTLRIMTLRIMTLSIMTFSIMTLSIMTLHNDTQHNDIQHNNARMNCHHTVVLLSVLFFAMLIVVKPNVILSVVVAPSVLKGNI